MTGIFSSLFLRTQSAADTMHRNPEVENIALGEARKVSKMKLAIVKPREPIPTTLTCQFGDAPKLRDRV